MATVVKFISHIYGNHQDTYYTDDYDALIQTLQEDVKFSCEVNAGITDGVVISNTFKGDFTTVNCAVVIHDTYGTNLYKIIKKEFIKRNLWRVTMKLDLVSKYFNDIKTSTLLVSRLGIDRSVFDPILFTPEEMNLSEVKTKQDLLTEIPGVKSYGYLLIWARNSLDGTIVWRTQPSTSRGYDIRVATLAELPIYDKKVLTSRYVYGEVLMNKRVEDGGQRKRQRYNYKYSFIPYPNSVYSESDVINVELNGHSSLAHFEIGVNANYTEGFNRFKNHCRNLTLVGQVVNNYPIYDNKIIYEANTGKYYRCIRETDIMEDYEPLLTKGQIANMLDINEASILQKNPCELYISEYTTSYRFELIAEVPLIEHTFLSYSNAIEQPFQIMFIPIIENTMLLDGDNNVYITSKEITERMIYDLISSFGGQSAKLLDVQLIPYAPIAGFASHYDSETELFNMSDLVPKEKIVIDNGTSTDFIIPIYEVFNTSYERFIPYLYEVGDLKIEQKKKFQLTSPSGSGVFEFSPSKNGGIEGFYISIDIRPFSTFHHMRPLFKSLYGGNFRDTRGLIWQEDTSLTQVSSAWETYKRQNINYLNSFETDVSYKQSVYSINVGTNWGNYGFDAGKRIIEAGVDAAKFAAEAVADDFWGVKGGAAGAVGAAVVMGGAILSEALEAGQTAFNISREGIMLDNEIDYSRRQFNYNLGNIQAIPENLGKVNGVFSTNNFIPYLQIFEPTEEEIVRYNQYLDLYGVNVGQVVDLSVKEFNYIQGTVLKFSRPIPNEEYIELCNQLRRGTRKYEEE